MGWKFSQQGRRTRGGGEEEISMIDFYRPFSLQASSPQVAFPIVLASRHVEAQFELVCLYHQPEEKPDESDASFLFALIVSFDRHRRFRKHRRTDKAGSESESTHRPGIHGQD